jgi:hypothetical protein
MSKWILNENNEKNPLIWGHKKNIKMLQKLEKSSEVVEFKISNKCFVALKFN